MLRSHKSDSALNVYAPSCGRPSSVLKGKACPRCMQLPLQETTILTSSRAEDSKSSDENFSYQDIYPPIVLRMLSLPLMEVVVDVVRTQPSTASIDDVEKELLSRLTDEIADENSPWHSFKAREPVISGDRTHEHYLCALDIALAARLGLKNAQKIAKFWKKMALLFDSSAITPSPSDISDTGVVPGLPSGRQEMLEALMERRKVVQMNNQFSLPDAIEPPGGKGPKELSCLSDANEGANGHLGSYEFHADVFTALGDTTLVDTSQTTPCKEKKEDSHPSTNRRPSLGGERQSPTKSFIPRRSFARSPEKVAATIASVKTKRLMFENMSRSPPPTQHPPPRKTNDLSTACPRSAAQLLRRGLQQPSGGKLVSRI